MKLSFLFSDATHTLHLVSVRGTSKRSYLTKSELEREARNAAAESGNPEWEKWDFVGALQNRAMTGPTWYGNDE